MSKNVFENYDGPSKCAISFKGCACRSVAKMIRSTYVALGRGTLSTPDNMMDVQGLKSTPSKSLDVI